MSNELVYAHTKSRRHYVLTGKQPFLVHFNCYVFAWSLEEAIHSRNIHSTPRNNYISNYTYGKLNVIDNFSTSKSCQYVSKSV